jgi:hypothetical protein
MTLDLILIEHPQVQDASTPIGYLKELLNCHWLLLKTCVEIANMLYPTWALLIIGVAEQILFLLGVVNLHLHSTRVFLGSVADDRVSLRPCCNFSYCKF